MPQAEDQRVKRGEVVKCDECNRARPIEQPTLEVFGWVVGFGPGGEHDAFFERDGRVECYRCSDGELP